LPGPIPAGTVGFPLIRSPRPLVRLTLPFVALIAVLSATPAAAVDATASYLITLGGINIASADIRLTDDGGQYAVDLDADVIGLGNIVARGNAVATTSGTVNGDELRPGNFRLETSANGERFTVTVEYSDGDATGFVIEPPLIFDHGRIPIERSHLRGVTDMMSAFLIKQTALDQNLCDHSARVFTGLEVFDIDMRFVDTDVATSQRTGYQGPVVLCAIRYVPVSGHFPESEITRGLAESDRILIWYMPLTDTGYFIPYRVLLTTTMGDLSMVLTRISGN
jgi:hypothetical protein